MDAWDHSTTARLSLHHDQCCSIDFSLLLHPIRSGAGPPRRRYSFRIAINSADERLSCRDTLSMSRSSMSLYLEYTRLSRCRKVGTKDLARLPLHIKYYGREPASLQISRAQVIVAPYQWPTFLQRQRGNTAHVGYKDEILGDLPVPQTSREGAPGELGWLEPVTRPSVRSEAQFRLLRVVFSKPSSSEPSRASQVPFFVRIRSSVVHESSSTSTVQAFAQSGALCFELDGRPFSQHRNPPQSWFIQTSTTELNQPRAAPGSYLHPRVCVYPVSPPDHRVGSGSRYIFP